MKFFFCETCGRRITDQQLLAGLARDKKLKGVYCGDCAQSVMTMEFESITDRQAREIVGETSMPVRVAKPRRSGLHTSVPKPVENVGSNAGVATAPKSILPIAMISGAAFILGALAFWAILNSTRPSESQSKRDAMIVAPPKALAAAPVAASPVAQSAVVVSVEPPRHTASPVAPAVVQPARVENQATVVPEKDTSEAAAQAAFDKATRFDGLEKNDAAGRIKRLEEFLTSYPDTIVSARARIQIADLKTSLAPKPAPLPPAVVNTPSGQDVDLFTTQRPTFGWSFDNGQEFPGAKGGLALDPAMKHGDHESLQLNADFSAGGRYVQLGRDLTALKVDPSVISFWIRAPGLRSISLRLGDSSGQCHQIVQNLEPVTDDWREISIPVEKFFATHGAGEGCKTLGRYEKWGGANDGKWHGPITGLYVLLGCPGDIKTAKLWVAELSAKARAK